MFTTHRPYTALALSIVALGLSACAINPATGKRQLMLISERQEIEMGRQYDRSVLAEMGTYEDTELAEYVSSLGQKLAAVSERPELEWTFRVVDDPVVNAFALPGGYIYITRGILAHMQNEAELVSVLGHEIGHVTARHSANQLSKAQLTQVGLGVGIVLAPEEALQFGDVVSQGLGLMFLQFGRDDERQADDLGLRYSFRAGYDPRPTQDMFDTLARVSDASGSERLPSWMSTHPAPENRSARLEKQIGALSAQADLNNLRRGRQTYFERIDGIVFGPDPREGFFRDTLFLHPELRFQFQFPQGWSVRNTRQAVVGGSPRGNASISLTLAQERTADEGLEAFFGGEGVARMPPRMNPIADLPTAGYGFKASTSNGIVEGRVGFVEYESRVYRLVGYATEEAWDAYEPTIRDALASFHKLRDRNALDVEPRRLKIVEPDQAMSLEAFARRYGSSVPIVTLQLLNALEPGEGVSPGRPYKVVVGGDLP